MQTVDAGCRTTAGVVLIILTVRTLERTAVQFEDGWCWIPNIGARRALTKARGNDSDLWIGRRLAITLTTVTRTDRASGRLIEKTEKTVEPLPDVADIRCISEGRKR